MVPGLLQISGVDVQNRESGGHPKSGGEHQHLSAGGPAREPGGCVLTQVSWAPDPGLGFRLSN